MWSLRAGPGAQWSACLLELVVGQVEKDEHLQAADGARGMLDQVVGRSERMHMLELLELQAEVVNLVVPYLRRSGSVGVRLNQLRERGSLIRARHLERDELFQRAERRKRSYVIIGQVDDLGGTSARCHGGCVAVDRRRGAEAA